MGCVVCLQENSALDHGRTCLFQAHCFDSFVKILVVADWDDSTVSSKLHSLRRSDGLRGLAQNIGQNSLLNRCVNSTTKTHPPGSTGISSCHFCELSLLHVNCWVMLWFSMSRIFHNGLRSNCFDSVFAILIFLYTFSTASVLSFDSSLDPQR